MEDTGKKRTVRSVSNKMAQIPRRKRVAAYCRVSSSKDMMLHSLSNQVSYYSDYIQKHIGWEYAGVYVDEGITGTKAERPRFQQMLEDCRAGKIDMIMTKSISRLARNTLTVLNTVRELKAMGVDVYFEEQNIHSMSGDGELMLTLLASFAQAESESVSENCKWRIKNGFENGIASGWNFMFGYRIEKKNVVLHDKEAAIVRWIFRQYLTGMGPCEIARLMRYHKVKTMRGGIWTHKRVAEILKNEKYTGDMLLQKRFVSNPLTKVLRRNHGQLPQYYVENTHPAIISHEDFEKAQEIMRVRGQNNGPRKEESPHYVFTRKIVCDNCGKRYRRKISRTENAWNCATYLDLGKACCHTKQIPEDKLMAAAASVLGLPEFDQDVFEEQIEEIHVPAFNHLVFWFKDGRRVERIWEDRSRSESWTSEMRERVSLENKRRRAK